MQGRQNRWPLAFGAMAVDAAVMGCCEAAKSRTPVLGVTDPYAMGNVFLTMHARENDRETHVRGPGSISQIFHCRDVRETLDLSQCRATSEGTSFPKRGASR